MTDLLSQITTAANSDDPALMKKVLCLVESVMMAEAMAGAPFRIDTDSDFSTPIGMDRAALERRTVEMIATAMAVVFHGDATEWLGFMSKAKQFRALFPLAAHPMAGGWQDIGTGGAVASGVDDDEQTPVLLWIEGGGWKGEGCQAIGYILRRHNGELVGKPNGYSGFTVKLWQPLPAPPLPTPRPYTLKEMRDGEVK